MYCIYTDRDVPETEGNFDHIVPRSLGGIDKFCVWSEMAFNSHMGQTVDGAVANDPLIMFARRNADARGHSGTEPNPVFKKSEIDGRPVQVTFEKDKLKIWDARSRKVLENTDTAGKEIKSEFSLKRYSSIRLAAKVALGGAYFVYGREILEAIDCDELRHLIELDVDQVRSNTAFQTSRIRVCDRFHEDLKANDEAIMFKTLCEFTKRTTFICVPHAQSISFHIGILGTFLCSLICPAMTKNLPNDIGLHDLGCTILLGPGGFEQMSFRQILRHCYQARTGLEQPSQLEVDKKSN